ncbi:MAG: hypothetical protein IPL46_02410 [Saprospiraceae bacterium]|nr:hypothetical protein [Saprospiraceae bacterium]
MKKKEWCSKEEPVSVIACSAVDKEVYSIAIGCNLDVILTENDVTKILTEHSRTYKSLHAYMKIKLE